jgi:chromosome segregation ATPase
VDELEAAALTSDEQHASLRADLRRAQEQTVEARSAHESSEQERSRLERRAQSLQSMMDQAARQHEEAILSLT